MNLTFPINSGHISHPLDHKEKISFEKSPEAPDTLSHDNLHPPSLRLLNVLIEKGIVDPSGHLNLNIHSASGECVELYNKKMEEFLSRPREIHVGEMDLTIKISLSEIFEYLNAIEPAVSIEVLKKNALYFIGFEGIDKTFKSWGIDLVEVCGEEYVWHLKNEIENQSTYFLIQYFIDLPDFSKAAHLKRGVMTLLASKLTLIHPDSSEYKEEIADRFIDALCRKKDRHYSDWLKDFWGQKAFLDNYVADEFLISNHTEPKLNSANPFSAVSLEFEENTIELEFSHATPIARQRDGEDAVHLPLCTPQNSLELQKYDCHLVQGIIDAACQNITPIPFVLPALEDWSKLLVSSIKGKTCRTQNFQKTIVLKIIDFINNYQAKNPQISFGETLGEFFSLSFKKMQAEDPSLNCPHAALALTIAASESLCEYISPQELQNFIQKTACHWDAFFTTAKEDPIYYALAEALRNRIPYPLISAYLQMGAYHILETQAMSENVRLWLNLRGSEDNATFPGQLEEIIQLELKGGENSFFLQVPNHPYKTGLAVLNHCFDCEKNEEALNELASGLTANMNSAWIPHLKTSLPAYFDRVLYLAGVEKEKRKRSTLIKRFCKLLQAENSLLSKKEIHKLEEHLQAISSSKSNSLETLLGPFFELFGQSRDPVLNKAAYEVFKKQDISSPLCVAAARCLCKGNLPNAVKTFVRMAKGAPANKKLQLELLDSLCSNLKTCQPNDLILHIDTLSAEIERALAHSIPFNHAHWLAEQLIFIKKTDLAAKAIRCIKNTKENARMIEKLKKEVSFQDPAVRQNPYANLKTKSDAALAASKLLKIPSTANFSLFTNLLQLEKVQAIFKDEPEAFWKELITPALEKISLFPLPQARLFYAYCLNELSEHPPELEDLRHFTLYLKKGIDDIPINESIPKNLKEALEKNQSVIFNSLVSQHSHNDLIELVNLFSLRGINFQLNTVEPILVTIINVLENSPDKETIKNVFEILNSACFKKNINESHHAHLADIYSLLAMVYFTDHFNMAFNCFQKMANLSKNRDEKLFALFMDRCGKENRLQEFANITQKIPLGKEGVLQECWGRNFDYLFLASNFNEELHETELKAASDLLHAPIISSLLSNFPLSSSQFLERLLNIQTRSPFLNKTLKCALTIVQISSISKKSIIEIYKLLKFSSDIRTLKKAWDVLKDIKSISGSEKNECWGYLIQAVKHVKFKKVFEALNSPVHFPIFDPKHSNNAEAYTILFTQLEKNWAECGTQKDVEKVKALYRSLQNKPWFKKPTRENRELQLAFATCLSNSAKPKDQKQANEILLKCFTEYFKEKSINTEQEKSEKFYGELNKNFYSNAIFETALDTSLDRMKPLKNPFIQWDKTMVHAFKKIIANAKNDKSQLYPFVELIYFNPDHKAGCFLIEKLIKGEPTDQDLSSIGRLIFRLVETSSQLVENSPQLSLTQFSDFILFCNSHSFNLKEFFKKIELFSDKTLNIIALDCLQLEKMKTFLKESDIADFIFQANKNILNYCVLTKSFEVKVMKDIFQRIPQYRMEKSEHDFKEFIILFFDFIYNGYVSYENGFFKFCNFLNSILKIWSVNPHLSKKYEREVIDLDDLFYSFTDASIRWFFQCSSKKLMSKLIYYIIGILENGLENPENHKPKFFEVLLHFSYLCSNIVRTTNKEKCADSEKGSSNQILEKFEQYLHTVHNFLKKFSSRDPEIQCILKIFHYYEKSYDYNPVIKKGTQVSLYEHKHEMISSLSQWLKNSRSELVLQLSICLFHSYLKDLLPSLGFALAFLNELTSYNSKLNSEMQGTFYGDITRTLADFFNAITNREEIRKTKEFKYFEKAVVENLKSYTAAFNNCSLNQKKCLNLISSYEDIIKLSMHVIGHRQSNLLKKSTEGFVNLCGEYLENNPSYVPFFKKLSHAPLTVLSSDYSNFISLENKGVLLDSFIDTLLRTAKKSRESMRIHLLIHKIKLSALTQGFYKNYEEGIESFIKLSLICLDQPEVKDEIEEKIALSMLTALIKFPKPPQEYKEIRLNFLNSWIDSLVANGKKYNRQTATKSCLQKLIFEAKKQGLYENVEGGLEQYKQHLLIIKK